MAKFYFKGVTKRYSATCPSPLRNGSLQVVRFQVPTPLDNNGITYDSMLFGQSQQAVFTTKVVHAYIILNQDEQSLQRLCRWVLSYPKIYPFIHQDRILKYFGRGILVLILGEHKKDRRVASASFITLLSLAGKAVKNLHRSLSRLFISHSKWRQDD